MVEPLYYSIIKSARAMFFGLGMKVDSVGEQNLPRHGGAVLAINHTSFLDFIFAGVPADDNGHRFVRFMAKDGVFKHPVAGPLMRGMKHIPVDRAAGAQAFDDAVAALRRGELVGVFPEATMSRAFDIKDLKNGAARMAMAAEVPLIPLIVFGGQRMLSYDHRDFGRGKTIAITVGTPMHPQESDDPNEVTAQLRERMVSLLDDTAARYFSLTGEQPDADAWWCPARLGGGAPTLEEAAAIDAEVARKRRAKRASSS